MTQEACTHTPRCAAVYTSWRVGAPQLTLCQPEAGPLIDYLVVKTHAILIRIKFAFAPLRAIRALRESACVLAAIMPPLVEKIVSWIRLTATRQLESSTCNLGRWVGSLWCSHSTRMHVYTLRFARTQVVR